jgi:collagen type III alpha
MRGNPPVNKLLQALDQDGDGQLSQSEIQEATTALKTLDGDGDGKLSRDEIGWPPMRRGFGRDRSGFGRGGPPGGFGPRRGGGPGRFGGPPGGQRSSFTERIMANDENGDGKLTRDELPEFMQRMFERMDGNDDGEIDKGELEETAARFRRGNFGDNPRRGRPERPQRPPMEKEQPEEN